MSKIRAISQRIKSISSTEEITQAMRIVASTKLESNNKRLLHLKTCNDLLKQQWKEIACRWKKYAVGNEKYKQNLLCQSNEQKNRGLIILLGSQRGLCGAFNQQILAAFEQNYKLLESKYKKLTFLPIGKAMQQYLLNKNKVDRIDKYTHISSSSSYEEIAFFFDFLKKQFITTTYDTIYLLYQSNPHASKKSVSLITLFPFQPPCALEHRDSHNNTSIDVIIEPDHSAFIDYLVSTLGTTDFCYRLFSSFYSEERARMWAMSQASENAKKLRKELQIKYNRMRQQIITRQLIEIAAGAEALNN